MASIIKFTLYFHRPSFLSHDKILKWNSSSSPHLPHLLLPLLLLLHHLLFLSFLCFILFTVEREREREKDVLYKIWQGRFLSWDDRRRLQNVSHSVGRVSGGFKPLFLRRPYGPTDILQEGICVGLVREDQIDDDLLSREIKLRLFQILRRTVPHSVWI